MSEEYIDSSVFVSNSVSNKLTKIDRLTGQTHAQQYMRHVVKKC